MKTCKGIFVLFLLSAIMTGCGTTRDYVHVGENWAYLDRLPAGEGAKVAVRADKGTYRIGEVMEFTVKADSPGKLWIITVGPDDHTMIVFPRARSRENSIRANEPLRIPGKDRDWSMVASEPAGANLVIAMVTGPSVTFDDVAKAVHDNSIEDLMAVHGLFSKWGKGKTVIEIRK